MTLEEIGVLSQLVGTLGVIASLVFVGVQIRQNTKATRAQVHESITSGYQAAAQSVTTHAEVFARGIAATPESFSAFSEADKMTYFGVIFGFFKHFENMHAQYENGYVDPESWTAWSEHMLMYFHQPGVQVWWSLRKGTFRPSFRAFLETTPPPRVRSMVEVLRDKA